MLYQSVTRLFMMMTLGMILFFDLHSVLAYTTSHGLEYVPEAAKVLMTENSTGTQKTSSASQLNHHQLQGLVQSEETLNDSKNNLPTVNTVQEINTIKSTSKDLVTDSLQKKQFMRQQNAPHVVHQHLYYFISFSMPLSLIEAYTLDAIWTHGVVVLRGVSPNETLHRFIFSKLYPLMNYKGAHAQVDINPNLFEKYHITLVPSIVFSTADDEHNCHSVPVMLSKQSGLTYPACQPIPVQKYWKVVGNVSTWWALQAFKRHGANDTDFINRLIVRGYYSPKLESAYTGNWQHAPLPFDDEAIKHVLSQLGLSETNTGMVGTPSLVQQQNKRQATTEIVS